MINFDLLIPALITTLIAILGWYVVHLLNARRDRDNKRMDLRTQYLIEAYRRIEKASNRPRNFDNNLELESAIADVQLLGSPDQVILAEKFAYEIAENSHASTNELLYNLRASLRKALKLGVVRTEITFLRLDEKQ